MTASAFARVALALVCLVAWLVTSAPAEAQRCRRKCRSGEKRDARGCCIPRKKARPTTPDESELSSDSDSDNGSGSDAADADADADDADADTEDTGADNDGDSATDTGDSDSDLAEDTADQSPEGQPSTDQLLVDESQPTSQNPGSSSQADGEQAADLVTTDSSDADNGAPEPVRPAKRRARTWPRWLMLGGGAALALGGVVHLRAFSLGREFDDTFASQCPNGCQEEFIPATIAQLDSARRHVYAAMAVYAVGGMIAAVGVTWSLLDRGRETETSTDAGSLVVTPWFHGTGTGAAVRIDF